MTDDSIYYPDYDAEFDNKILTKYEFKDLPERNMVYSDPRQLLIRNLISKNTIYDNILLFWGTGSGKSAASILITEGFKEYVLNMGRKIIVLVKNGNIEENFRSELLSDVTQNAYISDENNEFLKTANSEIKKEFMNKINRKINKTYDFITYGTFINQVIGAKVYEKDELGHNTSKKLKNKDGSDLRRITNNIQNLNNSVIIVDEAHNITNNDLYISLMKVLENSYNYRLVLLTATPMYDNPTEIFELSNLLNVGAKNKILPTRNKLFDSMVQKTYRVESSLLKSGLVNITNAGKSALIKSLKGKVSYLQVNTDTFPMKIDIGEPLTQKSGGINIVYCKMSGYQYNIYKTALKLDTGGNDIIDEDVKSSSLYKNSSDASTMSFPNDLYGKEGFNLCFKEQKNGKVTLKSEYSNVFKLTGDLEKYSIKLKTLLVNVNKSPGNVFIYSNYVNQGGTALIKQLLLHNGYSNFTGKHNTQHHKSFILYDESYTSKEREHYRDVFNNTDNNTGKYIKIIIGSPLISEGITLKNVRQIHILEPAWNMSTLNQIIGRGIRHHSHISLPLKDRNVKVYKYCSVYNDTQTYYIDKEKYLLSDEKDRANKVVERLLKTVSFDCEYNNKQGIDHSSTCDYTKCDYKCLIKNNKPQNDKFTYNLYIKFFDKFDIDLNIALIKQLFKTYFVWELKDLIEYIKEYEPVVSNESIYIALKQIIDNKLIIPDQYNRDGFIIQAGNYFVFNPIDIDINSSIYSKMLNFSINSNDLTLNDFTKIKNITLNEPIVKTTVKKVVDKKLSESDIKYNRKIIKSKRIYGSYREKPTRDIEFGAYDGVFKISDSRQFDTTDLSDKRKTIHGQRGSTISKKKLKDIIEYLNIKPSQMKTYIQYDKLIDINKLQVVQLVDIIEKHLIATKAILK